MFAQMQGCIVWVKIVVRKKKKECTSSTAPDSLLPQLSEEDKKLLMNRLKAEELLEASELQRLSALLDWVLYLHESAGQFSLFSSACGGSSSI